MTIVIFRQLYFQQKVLTDFFMKQLDEKWLNALLWCGH